MKTVDIKLRAHSVLELAKPIMSLQPLGELPVIEGWGVTFIMNDNGSRIKCQVAGDALEDIEHAHHPGAADRLAIFNRNRTTFEAIATKLYAMGYEPHVRSKHLPR